MAYIAVCRIGDTGSGTCDGHSPSINVSGTITTGSGNVSNGGIKMSTTGDIITASCGHTGTIIGSGSTLVNNKNVARIGDPFTGTFHGNLTSGSGNITSS